jgi:glycosyltransferase involved in cell wall biosynthesis
VTADIDVVIPTLNAASHLPRILAALRAAGGDSRLSVTVCDGGSRDDTLAIAR